MDRTLRAHAETIVKESISAVLPDRSVRRALRDYRPGPGKKLLIAVGKAAWRMARAALDVLGSVDGGLVITKYGHVFGELPGVKCAEAAHPVPDENSFAAASEALGLVGGLREGDDVIFLLSGGGSSLFELPLIPPGELRAVTRRLLLSGADIIEINTVRKRLSAVKGGRFALACAPARVFCVLLSDVVGGRADMIASGPACPDPSTCEEALSVTRKYGLHLSPEALCALRRETPFTLDNVTVRTGGSVAELCAAAALSASRLGYSPVILTETLACQARDAGRALAAALRVGAAAAGPMALIAGGETVVRVWGSGSGGRCQELALAAAPLLRDLPGAAVFAFGSDGADGPTDAAGGYSDCDSCASMEAALINPAAALENNDSYRALRASGGLIFTGPTGTNVNDAAVALLRR